MKNPFRHFDMAEFKRRKQKVEAFARCVKMIESAWDPNWHPDTRREARTQLKLEVILMLTDIINHWDRSDGLDSEWLPIYDFIVLHDKAKQIAVEYLIDPDTLPSIPRYHDQMSNSDYVVLDQALDKIKDKEIKACLECARLYFSCRLAWKYPTAQEYIKILKKYY